MAAPVTASFLFRHPCNVLDKNKQHHLFLKLVICRGNQTVKTLLLSYVGYHCIGKDRDLPTNKNTGHNLHSQKLLIYQLVNNKTV